MLAHTIAYFAIRAVNGALAVASLFVLTRLLEPAQYGIYALGLAAINVFASVLFQWLNVGVARFYAAHERPEELLSVARQLFYCIGAGGLVVCAGWALVQPSTVDS